MRAGWPSGIIRSISPDNGAVKISTRFPIIGRPSTENGASVPGIHPFAVGPWRAPAANTNIYARDLHINLMAAKAGQDPLEFRLGHLKDKRMRRVLEAAAKQFGWTPAKTPSGRGFGISCGIDAETYVASMAEVEVDRSSGKSRSNGWSAPRTWAR